MSEEINYDKIPEHCRAGMKRYIEEGFIPGDFLQAIISNNFVEAYKRADYTNTVHIINYADFLYNEAPMRSWGSERIMFEWHEEGGLKGKESKKEGD